MSDRDRTAPRAWALALVALAAGGVFANSIVNGFALDDVAIVQHNPHVLNLEWTTIWAANYWPTDNGPTDVLYRPLTIWSYLANHALTPVVTGAWAFHLVNILMHMLVSVMVTVLAWRIFRSRAVAIVTGIIFALHPIHTEVVANTVGRAELIAAIWSLAALLVFIPEEDMALGPTKRPWYHGFIVAACFLYALFAKETPAALVGAIGFIDLWRWSHWNNTVRPTFVRFFAGQTLRYYLPLMVAFAIYMAMRTNATDLMRDINTVHPVVNPLVSATIGERLLTPFMLLAKYLQLMVWPAVLVADYSKPSIMPSANPLHPGIAAGLLVTALGLVVTAAYWRRLPRVVLCIWLFVFAYALASNFLRIGTIFGERLFYWPSVFVSMLMALGLVKMWAAAADSPRVVFQRGVIAMLFAAACVAMSWRTVTRNTDWADNIPLAIATGRDNLQSAKACYWAGSTLTSQDSQPDKKPLGVELLKRAIDLYPGYGESYWELAKHFGREKRMHDSLVYLARAAKYRAGTREVRQALAAVKLDLAAYPLEDLLKQIEAAEITARDEAARALARGLVYSGHGQWAKAEAAFEEGLKADPQFHELAAELATARLARGELESGVDMLRQYVMVVRYNYEARCVLAEHLAKLDLHKFPNALAEAEMNLQKAEKMLPGGVKVREIRAQINRRKAEQQAAQAGNPAQVSSLVKAAP